MFKQLIIFVLLCSSALAQVKVDVAPFLAITAKSAKVEPLDDKVAVFLTERDPGERTGAFLTITSQMKWATPYLDTVEFKKTTQPSQWMMFAKPGKYRVTIIEFDPELGPMFSGIDVVIPGTITQPPIDPPPVDPPPTPTPDFVALQKLSDELADKLADPSIRKVLGEAYGTALKEITAKALDYDQAVVTVAVSRFAALSTQPMTKDWNGVFLKPIGLEVGKLVKVGDISAYFKAITAIKLGLEQ